MIYKTIDLCAGIGGIRRGFELTGKFENVLSAEIDPSAAKTYEHLYGDNPLNDLTSDDFKDKVAETDYDVLLAGFPCQTFSRVGKQLGFRDKTRGTIFFDIADIISRTNPRAVFLENVENLVSHDKGQTIRTIIETLEDELQYRVIGVSLDDDGNYVYKITATLGRHEETKAFPIVIDSVPPEVISSRIEGANWIVTVHDNHFIQGVCATATGNEPITKWIEPDAVSSDATSEITFDLSTSGFKGLTQAKIALIDYAGNTYISDYYSLSAAEVIYPQSVTLDKSALVLTEGESAMLNAEIMPQNASNKTVTWSISDTDVAQISASGKVTAKKTGNAVITAQTVNGIKASCDITVNEKQAETLPIAAAVSVKKNTLTGNIIPFRFQLGNIKKVATVSFTFQKDDALQFESLIGKNGFTPLGIKWNNDNTATIALSYLQNGAGGSLTKNELFDAAEVQFKEILNDMTVGIRLVDVSAAGYDKNGKAVYFTTKITAESANTNVTKKSSCDVNADGVVDLLDITYCQKFYRMGEKSIDWNDFKHCDLDGNGLIDIEDLIIILKVM